MLASLLYIFERFSVERVPRGVDRFFDSVLFEVPFLGLGLRFPAALEQRGLTVADFLVDRFALLGLGALIGLGLSIFRTRYGLTIFDGIRYGLMIFGLGFAIIFGASSAHLNL